MPSASNLESVEVAVRVRPLVKTETDRGCQSIVNKTPSEPQIVVRTGKKIDTYTFNHVFIPGDSQESIFTNCIQDKIPHLFKGYNVTILAYGQTGSGKTFTMDTNFTGGENPSMGVIPRTIINIFQKIEELQDEYKFVTKCSFIELYMEQLYDLLSTNSREKTILDIREDGNGIKIPGLTEVSVKNVQEAIDCLERGSAGRVTGATAMNAQSSRSHAIFSFILNSIKIDDINVNTTAQFHLVDLAGSERPKKTLATGNRFQEGVKINHGLLVLGNVISQLGSSNYNGFVPYRESKLTRLLQDSLGGNSVTLLIACVSPADYNLEETLNTLRYADRAKKIKNKPIVNQDAKQNLIQNLKDTIMQLRVTLAGEDQMEEGNNECVSFAANLKQIKRELILSKEKYLKYQEQMQNAINDMCNVEIRTCRAETLNEELYTKIKTMQSSLAEISFIFDEEITDDKYLQFREDIKIIKSIIEELYKTLLEHRNEIESYNITVNPPSLNNSEIDEHFENHTTKQVSLSQELRQINKELALKEELHQKYAANLTIYCGDDNNQANKINEYKQLIETLENERTDLMYKLKADKQDAACVKLAKERKKRLDELEIEINELTKRHTRQTNLLKIKEKDSEKIDTLKNDIQEMKAQKVRVIRMMKSENDDHKLLKKEKVREICQLKKKDRQNMIELAKVTALHTKTQQILQRKFEKAEAANETLRLAMEKHEKAQLLRKTNGKQFRVSHYMEKQIEFIKSILSTESFLEQLTENRKEMVERLEKLKSEPDMNTNIKLIEALENDIKTCTTQINVCHKKITSTNLENQVKKIYEDLHDVVNSRPLVLPLLSAVTDTRIEGLVTIDKNRKLGENIKELEYEYSKIEQTIIDKKTNFISQKIATESSYEEKIQTLLKGMNNSISHEQSKQKGLELLDQKRKQLEELKLERSKLQSMLQTKSDNKRKRSRVLNENTVPSGIIDTSMDMFSDFDQDDDDDDIIHDPDWTIDEVYNTKRESRNNSNSNNAAMISYPNKRRHPVLEDLSD